MNMDNQIGDRLYMLRSERHLSQEEIASALNMKVDTYRSIERGRTKGRVDTLKCISEYFGVSLDYLVYGERDMTNEISILLSDLSGDMQEMVYKILKAVANELK